MRATGQMLFLTGDLGPTATYSRREYRWVGGLGGKLLDWPDARDGTLWVERWTAKRRHGTRSWLARYAVGEIEEVGFVGRVFLFDREFPDDPPAPGEPEPPYKVRLTPHGECWCTCMAGQCKAASCVHTDAVLVLIDEGAFGSDPLDRYGNTGEDAGETEVPEDADWYPEADASDEPAWAWC